MVAAAVVLRSSLRSFRRVRAGRFTNARVLSVTVRAYVCDCGGFYLVAMNRFFPLRQKSLGKNYDAVIKLILSKIWLLVNLEKSATSLITSLESQIMLPSLMNDGLSGELVSNRFREILRETFVATDTSSRMQ